MLLGLIVRKKKLFLKVTLLPPKKKFFKKKLTNLFPSNLNRSRMKFKNI